VTFVLAGNTSVTLDADDCAEEGCPGPRPYSDSGDVREFLWSDDMGWNVTGVLEIDVPSEMSYVTIRHTWTVFLDMTTPILNILEIRGILTVLPDNELNIVLDTFYIDVKGGSMLFGNHTHPYEGEGEVRITIHGDPYVHGNECRPPAIQFSSQYEMLMEREVLITCGKRIDVNGDFVLNGKVRVTQATLGEDTLAGSNVIVLSEDTAPWMQYNETQNVTNAESGGWTLVTTTHTVCDWKVGDELIVTGSDHAAVTEEDFFITDMSDDCRTVTMSKGLARNAIGVLIQQDGDTVLDMRARIGMVTRNIVLEGGDHWLYDRISGIDPKAAEMGGSLFAFPPYKEIKDGWKPSDVGFEKYGYWRYPAGTINMNYVYMTMWGKQHGLIFPCTLVAYSHVHMQGHQTNIKFEGIVDRNPMSGGGGLFDSNWWNTKEGEGELMKLKGWWGGMGGHSYHNNNRNVIFKNNILIGVGQDFGPTDGFEHIVENNLFIGGAGYCRIQCTPDYTSLFRGNGWGEGAGKLAVRNNLWNGGWKLVKWRRTCSVNDVFEDNYMIGGQTGFVYDSCANIGVVHAYRNSLGIATHVNRVSGFVLAENGVGAMSYHNSDSMQPACGMERGTSEAKSAKMSSGEPWGLDGSRSIMNEDYSEWLEGYVRGVDTADAWSEHLQFAQAINQRDDRMIIIGQSNHWAMNEDFDMCSGSAGSSWFGGSSTGPADIGGMTSGYGSWVDYHYSGYQYTMRGDAKMWKGTWGEGYFFIDGVEFQGFSGVDQCGFKNMAIGNEAAGFGEGSSATFGHNAIFGSTNCVAFVVSNLIWGSGINGVAEVPPEARFRFSHGFAGQTEGKATGFAKCTVYDKDGSIVPRESAPHHPLPFVYSSQSKNKIPQKIITDCGNWDAASEEEKNSNPDLAGACLWWIREYPELVRAVSRPEQHGVIKNDGTGDNYNQLIGAKCESRLDDYNNLQLCSNITWTYVPAAAHTTKQKLHDR
jgi:hypothetical protein